MLVPKIWLEEYIDVDIDFDDLCETLIVSGTNIDAIKSLMNPNVKNVVVGEIKSIEKHENADRLLVCQVSIGSEDIQIVTGAKNVFVSAKVPVVLVGGTVCDRQDKGLVNIKKGKLRGVLSQGMMCGIEELGIDKNLIPENMEDGIWILPENLKVGEPIEEVLKLSDEIFDFEITSNRPDCLSVIGIAREVASLYSEKIKLPEGYDRSLKEDSPFDIEIDDSNIATSFSYMVSRNIEVKDSPWWLQRSLMGAGIRPINNIVDISNFVMLEYGRPIHIYNLDKLTGNKISVELSKGESFSGLDQKDYELGNNTIVIKDDKPQCIAGVLGGASSQVDYDTKNILIEVANFNKDNIRNTAKELGVRTESSYRFERGVDGTTDEVVLMRIAQLISDLEVSKEIGKPVIKKIDNEKSEVVSFRVDRVNHILGLSLSEKEMLDILDRLGFKETKRENDRIFLEVPSFRQDISIEEDIAEEVARIYGYNKMPLTLPMGKTTVKDTKDIKVSKIVKDTLTGFGFFEIQNYSFQSPKNNDRLLIPEDSWERDNIKLKNPLGEETSVMRTGLLGGMLQVINLNESRKNKPSKYFEMGNVFSYNLGYQDMDFEEEKSLIFASVDPDEDFFTLKGTLLEILSKLGITDVNFLEKTDYETYHSGICAEIKTDREEVLGIIGQISPMVLENYKISNKVYACQLFYNVIEKNSKLDKEYRPLYKYPAINRDIALIVDENIKVSQIMEILKENGGTILKEVNLFDIYRGHQIGENKKNLGFSLEYRDFNRTLTDEDIEKVQSKIIKELENKLDAKLRDI